VLLIILCPDKPETRQHWVFKIIDSEPDGAFFTFFVEGKDLQFGRRSDKRYKLIRAFGQSGSLQVEARSSYDKKTKVKKVKKDCKALLL